MTTAVTKCNVEILSGASRQSVQSGASAEALQAMFAHTTERISIVDRDYRFQCVSPAVSVAWDKPADEFIGLELSQLMGEHSFSAELKRYVDQALAGEPVRHAFWQTLPPGHVLHEQRRFMDYQISPWLAADGENIGAVIRVQDRTAQQQAEEDLAMSQQRLSDFANATSDWLWEMDSNLCFVWISREVEGFFDLDRRQLYGQPRKATPASKEEELAWAEHRRLLAKRLPFRDFDYRVKTLSGHRWARVSGVPVFDQDGEFCGYRGTSSDISQIKSIEHQVQQAETRLTRAIDEYPGAFALYDEMQSLVLFNRRFAEINAFIGDDLRPGLHYEECLRAQLQAGIYAQIDGETIVDHQQWIDRQLACPSFEPTEVRDHTGNWLRWSRQSLPDGGYLETLVDITNEKTSELVIKEERNLLRSLIDNFPDFLYAKDTQSRFIIRNRAVAHYMSEVRQASGEGALIGCEGTTDFDYYPADLAEQFYAAEKRVINDGVSILNQESLISGIDSIEPFWVSTTKVPLKDTEGRVIGLVGIGRKITEQKAAEAELRRSQARFRDFAETAAELFWETNESLEITWVSERYHEITGQPPSSILGHGYRQVIGSRLVHEEDLQRIDECMTAKQAFSDLEVLVGRSIEEERHLLLSGKPYFDGNGTFCGFRGAGRDVSKSRQLERQLSHQASHDELTGLPNRREFVRRLDSIRHSDNGTSTHSVMGYLDLDQFKIVNDSVGHVAGDHLLVQVADLISSQLREGDTVARLGGDEFGLLLHNCSLGEATQLMRRVIEQFEVFRFNWNNQFYAVGASIGLAPIADAEIDAQDLMSQADVACFAAKDRGRGRVHVYSPGDGDTVLHHCELLMAAGIRDSIARNRFCLYAQPIASVVGDGPDDLRIDHYEVLLRLNAEDGSLIYPGTFIPAAERYGLMGEIDRWVIENTFSQLRENAGWDNELSVTINLSGQSLSDDALAEFVVAQLEYFQLDPARVCFEITETATIRNLLQAQELVRRLKSVGCAFALDDFGSGMSSFGYLKSFSVDYLKIDGGFVRDIAEDETDRVMVESIDRIGKALGIKTIAEFVENDAVINELRAIGVDLMQGYGIGKPVIFSSCFGRRNRAA